MGIHIRDQKGFQVVLGIIALTVIGVVGLVGLRVMSSHKNDAPNNSATANTKQAEADIALQNLGVALSNVDVTKQAVREWASHGLKGFYIFGDKLDSKRINPNFEFASLKPGTKVVSAIDGVVGFIKEQSDSHDSEVFIQPKEGSAWTIGYDHLINLAVAKGDTVKAGDVLGEPAMQNNGLTRFEIQINKDENGQTTHYCPTTLLANDVKAEAMQALGDMQTAWETTTGLDLYDLSKQNPVGCLMPTLTPAQASGE